MPFDKPLDSSKRLDEVIKGGKIPHALMFVGPGQALAADAAKRFSALLFCKASEKLRPCGECDSCQLLSAGNHPDSRWVTPEDSGAIKIDSIRAMTREASLKPYRESRKVFVIERAESMNEHAQNALLKTLEEPPGPSHFILLTENPEALLPTVRSRVQKLFFADDARFTEVDEAEEAGRKEALDYIFGQTDKAPDWNGWERSAVGRVLETVLGDLRDILVIAAEAPELSRADHRPFKERAAKIYEKDTLIVIMEKIAAFKESIDQNSNLKLALAVLWSEARPQTIQT